MKKIDVISKLLIGIVGAALGILLLVLNGAVVLSFLVKAIGVALLVLSVPKLVAAISLLRLKSGKVIFAVALLGSIAGAVMLFLPVAAITVGAIVAGVWFIILPIVDICSSPNRSEQFKVELPEIVIGAFLIIIGPTALFSVIVKIVGGVIAFLSAVYIWFVVNEYKRYRYY